jgi:hypothetical protein
VINLILKILQKISCFVLKQKGNERIVMYRPIEMYQIVCDRCGEVFGGTDTCSSLFSDKDTDISDYSDWEMIDGKHYCSDCYDVEVIDGVYNVKVK